MFEGIKEIIKKNNYPFYKVDDKEVKEAENRMKIRIPLSLRCFYNEIGYGFIKGNPSFYNRIMKPDDIADFMCEDDTYEYVDKSIYDLDNKMVFFHISDEDFLTIDCGDTGDEKVYYFYDVIAESFNDFISKAIQDPNYYM